GLDRNDLILLGREKGGPRFVTTLREWKAEDGVVSIDLRTLAMDPVLKRGHLGALAHARSLTLWNRKYGFSGPCRARTALAEGGTRRDCIACGSQEFPRTDPVVIMLITDGENCLLGRSAHHRNASYSCLAGFLEPAETIEAAVRREVFEESGIKVGR